MFGEFNHFKGTVIAAGAPAKTLYESSVFSMVDLCSVCLICTVELNERHAPVSSFRGVEKEDKTDMPHTKFQTISKHSRFFE